MKRRVWKIKEISSQAFRLAKRNKISIFLSQVLLNRGIDEKDFNSFLNPAVSDLHCPLLLPDIKKAAARIKQAASNREKVLVFGDYDVDGITSLAIFNEFAKNFEDIFTFYIPHRVKEGYGLNREAIVRAKDEGIGLILAFDCGTNSEAEIELARKLSIDVIVVDHHLPGVLASSAFAFVNPKRQDCSYPFSDLSAAALSYKLLQVLTEENCHSVLDLVVLSLICDVVPSKGENRSLIAEGIRVIKQSSRPAIKALCKEAGVKQKNIDTFHIGYMLGPRINASGRVAHARDSLNLFLSEDLEECVCLAKKLGEYNRLRRNIETQILKEAEKKINETITVNNSIIVSGDKWHPGVLGIVASRLAYKYYRPSFVISFDDEGVGVGSGRSIEGIHLIEMLDECADTLLSHGGHKKAAGVQLDIDELENFKEKINSFIEENINPQDFVPSLNLDSVLDFKNINMSLAQELEKMKPYGEGNDEPLFLASGLFKKGAYRKIPSGFSIWLTDGKKAFEAVVRNKDILQIIEYAECLDIVFSLQIDHYHNIPRLIVRDCRLSDGP